MISAAIASGFPDFAAFVDKGETFVMVMALELRLGITYEICRYI